jgi:hypothetical protein
MGENAAKFRPEIELDEFERRLRAAAPASGAREPQRPDPQTRDPLAELARLVGGESGRGGDPFEALFRAQAAIADTRAAAGHPPQEPQDHYQERHFDDRDAYRHAPQSGHADPYARNAPHDEAEPHWVGDVEPPAAPVGWADEDPEAQFDRAPAANGRKKVFYGMAAILALGVLGIGATLGLRGKSGGQEVVTIKADPDPARVKPDQPAAAAAKNETLFDRKDHASGAKVVGGEEQPADLGATAKAARVVAAANAPAPPAQGAQGDSPFPTPKKVKTVSVRADGTVIGSGDARPQGTHGLPSMVNGFPSITPSAGAASQAKAPAPKTAAAPPTQQAAIKPPAAPAAVKPTAAPAAAKPAADASGAAESGGFAVQLAGSPVESEARAAANTLTAKYASVLKGHRASFAAAQVGDKTVYRVRIGHLSEVAAKDMCTAIKGQGGSCFVAKN